MCNREFLRKQVCLFEGSFPEAHSPSSSQQTAKLKKKKRRRNTKGYNERMWRNIYLIFQSKPEKVGGGFWLHRYARMCSFLTHHSGLNVLTQRRRGRSHRLAIIIREWKRMPEQRRGQRRTENTAHEDAWWCSALKWGQPNLLCFALESEVLYKRHFLMRPHLKLAALLFSSADTMFRVV